MSGERPFQNCVNNNQLKEYKRLLNINDTDFNKIQYEEYTGKRLIIMICSSCNINCNHCYISYKGDRDPEQLFDMVNKLKDDFSIELNGSEILINLDYLKAYKAIGQKHLISNGLAILNNPLTVEKLKENEISTVALSYHYGIQDSISMISEKQLLEVIKLLQKSDIEVRLMTTINTLNYNRIKEMCHFAYEIGARAIKFTNYIAQGNGLNSFEDNLLLESQKEEFFIQLLNERERYDKDILLVERCGTFGKNRFNEKDNFKCHCISNSVVITPDNNVYPCVFLAKPGYEIGKFIDNKIYIKNSLHVNSDECLTDNVCNKKLILKNRIGENK